MYISTLSHSWSLSILLVSPNKLVNIFPANNITLNKGDSITFICNTTAGPDNSYMWFKLGQDEICYPKRKPVTINGNIQLLVCKIHDFSIHK